MQTAELVLHLAPHTLYTFASTDLRFAPNIRYPNAAVELRSKLCPFATGQRLATVQAKIWPTMWMSPFVRESHKLGKHANRWVVPHVIRSQIFSSRRIADFARFVGQRTEAIQCATTRSEAILAC